MVPILYSIKDYDYVCFPMTDNFLFEKDFSKNGN